MNKLKINKLAILSTITYIIPIAIFLFFFLKATIEINNYIVVLCIICVLLSFTTIILSIFAREQIKKTKEKGKIVAFIASVIGIVLVAQFLGILSIILPMMNASNNDKELCKNVYECVKDENGVSKCDTTINIKNIRIKCTTNNLKEEQFKN